MEENEAQKYIIEQANIEVEQTRSWPTKVMAFYVAINFGVVGSLIALQKHDPSFALPCWARIFLTLLIIILSVWVVCLLGRYHLNYLRCRKLQVKFQELHLRSFKEKYDLPDDWFKAHEVRLLRRFQGWGFYLYIVCMVTVLVLMAISLVK